MICRQCEQSPATCSIRAGFEYHPTCDDCAAWWHPGRRYPLELVEETYYADRLVPAPVDDGG